jgi:hypothetical protein
VQTNAKVDLMLRQELEKQVAAALKEF